MKRFIKILAITAVFVPFGIAASFGVMMWPSLVFGYNHVTQGAWLLFLLIVFTALAVWYDEEAPK